MVTEPQGQAEVFLKVHEAQSKGMELISKANPNAAYITLKGLEALEKVSQSPSNKIIIPTEISNVTGLLTAMKKVVSDMK